MKIESGILFEVTNDDLDNGRLIIPEGVTEISSYALDQATNAKNVICPTTLKVIRQNAFASHPKLEKIEFNEGLEEIESSAFQACQKLKGCIFPTSLVELGNQAFNYCSSIEYASLSGHLREVGVMVFGECEHLKVLELATYECDYAPYLFSCCSHLETLIISSCDINLDDHSMLGCERLQTVILNLASEEEFTKQHNLLPPSLAKLLEKNINSFFAAVLKDENRQGDVNQHYFFRQSIESTGTQEFVKITELAAHYKLPDFFVDLAVQKLKSQDIAASSTLNIENTLVDPFCYS